MKKTIRYQGAILRDAHILLVLHREHMGGRSYWLLPGGGREDCETEVECVIREMKEETGLDVKVADDPLTCVARGTAIYLENLEEWKGTMESDLDDI